MQNLTLNLGLRWEFDQPVYEVNNKEANVNMATKQIEYAGVDGNSWALHDPVYTQFQPRFGFAYQISPRFVIRGRYGITSYLEGMGANLRLTQNPPFHTKMKSSYRSCFGPMQNGKKAALRRGSDIGKQILHLDFEALGSPL